MKKWKQRIIFTKNLLQIGQNPRIKININSNKDILLDSTKVSSEIEKKKQEHEIET